MIEQTPGLWDEPDLKYGETSLQATVRQQIEAINAETPLTPPQMVYAHAALALAKNIAMGNAKGRAIANEVAQLRTLIDLIAGVETDDGGTSTLDPEIKELMDAFAAPAAIRPDAATAGHHGP